MGWETPFEAIHKAKPMGAHIIPYGSKAFAFNKNIPKLRRLDPRAHIGYLVGWDSTNIFRIWVPSKKQVIRTRDVSFSRDLYKPTDLDIGAISIQEGQDIINSIELPEEELLEYEELPLVPLLEPSISTSSHNLNSKTTNNQTSRTNEDITSEYSQTSLEDSASQSNNSGASTSQSSDSEATISQSSDFKANTSQLNDFETSNSNSRTSNNAFRQDNNQISVNIPILPEHLKRKYELSEEDNNTIIKHQ